MYLVQVVTSKVSGDIVKSPKVDKISSFEFKLMTRVHSVLECVTDLGDFFEVHYGKDEKDNKADDCHERTSFVAIAPTCEKALLCANAYLGKRKHFDYADVWSLMPEGSVYLWDDTDIRASKFNLKLKA